MKTWTVDDVMTRTVVSVDESASYRDIVDLLVEKRFSAVPVTDPFRKVVGVVSEADLLRKIEYAGDEAPRVFDGPRRRGDRRKALARTASDLMSSPPVAVVSGTSIVAAARRMDRAGVKRLPVVDENGRLVGIVTRTDLLKVHLRSDPEILSDIRANVLYAYLIEDADKVDVSVADGAVMLSGRVDRWSAAELAVKLTRQVPGVVDVTSALEYGFDDRARMHAGTT